MKRFPLALIAAAVALVAIVALAGVGRPEAARGDAGAIADSVTTTGHGVVTVAPDQATVTAGVHTQAATAAEALSQNSAHMNDVIAALKSSRRQGPADPAGVALPAVQGRRHDHRLLGRQHGQRLFRRSQARVR